MMTAIMDCIHNVILLFTFQRRTQSVDVSAITGKSAPETNCIPGKRVPVSLRGLAAALDRLEGLSGA
jgi:hypothetical protein